MVKFYSIKLNFKNYQLQNIIPQAPMQYFTVIIKRSHSKFSIIATIQLYDNVV